MNKKDAIHIAAVVVGTGLAAATAAVTNNPTDAAVVGAVSYGVSYIFGRIEPGETVPAMTVTPADLQDAMRTVSDAQKRDYVSLAGDLASVLTDAKAVLASSQTAGPAAVVNLNQAPEPEAQPVP